MAVFIQIDYALKSRIRQLAETRRRSADWIMREATEQYVTREEQREAFKQEALQAWAAYQETGRHLTGEQTRDWLRTWGTADEQPAPERHE